MPESFAARSRVTTEETDRVPIRWDPYPGLLRWLLHLAYDGVWVSGIVLGSPWWLWRLLRDQGFRDYAADRLGRGLPDFRGKHPGVRRVLVHGVSVGEVKSALALARQLESAPGPPTQVVLSATTNTGLAVARKMYPEYTVVRFPFDLGFFARRFLRRIDPACIVLIELEIWPNFLREANRVRAPIAVVNGRITAKSFKTYWVFRNLLPQFDRVSLFCAQQEQYARRFADLCGHPSRVQVTGNLKVDGLELGRTEPDPDLLRLLGGRPGQAVLVCGSTHDPEERELIRIWQRVAPDARLIIAPRHPQRTAQIVEQLSAMGHPPQCLTQLREGGSVADPDRPALVDTIGELERVYSLSDVAFVGGSLSSDGGHNMLEPIAQGRPVVYGPHVHNFLQEAALLESAGAARRVQNARELGDVLRELLDDPELRERMSVAGTEAVRSQRGATDLTVRVLEARCLND